MQSWFRKMFQCCGSQCTVYIQVERNSWRGWPEAGVCLLCFGGTLREAWKAAERRVSSGENYLQARVWSSVQHDAKGIRWGLETVQIRSKSDMFGVETSEFRTSESETFQFESNLNGSNRHLDRERVSIWSGCTWLSRTEFNGDDGEPSDRIWEGQRERTIFRFGVYTVKGEERAPMNLIGGCVCGEHLQMHDSKRRTGRCSVWNGIKNINIWCKLIQMKK